MKEDLENLKSLGLQIESITCDGHKSLLKAIKKACKEVIVQRRTVHVQRLQNMADCPAKEQSSYRIKKYYKSTSFN